MNSVEMIDKYIEHKMKVMVNASDELQKSYNLSQMKADKVVREILKTEDHELLVERLVGLAEYTVFTALKNLGITAHAPECDGDCGEEHD